MSRIITWKVTGMTCHSCEKLIGEILNGVAGVEEAEVSLKQGRAGIRLRDDAKDPELRELNERLRAHGYTLVPESRDGRKFEAAACGVPSPARARFGARLLRAALAFAAVGAASAFILGPLREIVPSVSAGASFGAMLAFGLVASVSTCLASTGGFLLAYNGKPRTGRDLVAVHAGRLVTFLVGGALLGMVGGALPGTSASLHGALALALGLMFLVMGLHMLDLSPSPARLRLTLPGGLSKLGDRAAKAEGRLAPYLVGATTFVLPCGFTQTAQALALASGSPLAGMLIMGAFALGTLPVLAGLSAFGSAAALKHRAVRLATGAVLSLFAFGQIDGGLTVLGSSVTPGTLLASLTGQAAEQAIPAANAQEQVARMTVAYGTYQPRNLTVKKGIPVRWEIDGQDVSGCASTLIAPVLDLRLNLSPGMNIVRFTPLSTGTIPFSCGMGMIRGSFTVTN